MTQYIYKKQKIVKFIFWGVVVLIISFFTGKGSGDSNNIVTLKRITPRASADVPYNQSSYYNEGSGNEYVGGDDSSGDGSNSSGAAGDPGGDPGSGDSGDGDSGDGCG